MKRKLFFEWKHPLKVASSSLSDEYILSFFLFLNISQELRKHIFIGSLRLLFDLIKVHMQPRFRWLDSESWKLCLLLLLHFNNITMFIVDIIWNNNKPLILKDRWKKLTPRETTGTLPLTPSSFLGALTPTASSPSPTPTTKKTTPPSSSAMSQSLSPSMWWSPRYHAETTMLPSYRGMASYSHSAKTQRDNLGLETLVLSSHLLHFWLTHFRERMEVAN